MRIAIVGSREISVGPSPTITFRDHIHTLMNVEFFNEDTEYPTLVSGGADGIDSIAEGLAKGFGHPTLIFEPEWTKYGKSAAFKRNQKIVDAADKIVAFSFANSAGTEDTIARAIAAGKPTIVYRFTDHPGGGVAVEKEEYNV